LVKLRFRAKVARSGDLVCRDRVPIVGAYFREVFLHSLPPTRGRPDSIPITQKCVARNFKNWGLPLNLAPREGRIFTYAPSAGPLADKFTLIYRSLYEALVEPWAL